MLRAARDQLWRMCRIVGGILLLIVGLILSLPGVPGPGIVVIFVSFGILSRDFKWAERWHLRLKDMAQKVMNRRKTEKMKSNLEEHLMEEKDRLSNKLRDKGKADEEQYFAKRDRELLEKLKKKEQEASGQGEGDD